MPHRVSRVIQKHRVTEFTLRLRKGCALLTETPWFRGSNLQHNIPTNRITHTSQHQPFRQLFIRQHFVVRHPNVSFNTFRRTTPATSDFTTVRQFNTILFRSFQNSIWVLSNQVVRKNALVDDNIMRRDIRRSRFGEDLIRVETFLPKIAGRNVFVLQHVPTHTQVIRRTANEVKRFVQRCCRERFEKLN